MFVDRSRTRVFLVRHAQTVLNQADVFCGVTEVPLNSTGKAQALCLAELLRNESIQALYSSPQQRAVETAYPIASALGLDIQIRDALREIDFGSWENRSYANLYEEFPKEVLRWKEGSWLISPPGGETPQEVIARATRCFMDFLRLHQGEAIVVVSHGTTLRLLLGHLLDLSLSQSRNLQLEAGSLSELSVVQDTVKIVQYNNNPYKG